MLRIHDGSEVKKAYVFDTVREVSVVVVVKVHQVGDLYQTMTAGTCARDYTLLLLLLLLDKYNIALVLRMCLTSCYAMHYVCEC